MPEHGTWLTPDVLTNADTICRRFVLPADLSIVAAFSGAVLELTKLSSWQAFGTMTEQEVVDLLQPIVLDGIYSGDWCMLGALIPYVSVNPPAFSLICDGAIYNRVDYPQLYAAIDPAFIIDADTFAVPDLVGKFPLGATLGGVNPFPIGSTGGEVDHTLTIAEMPAHDHTDAGHVHGESTATPTAILIGAGAPAPSALPGAGFTASASASIQPTGGDGSHNNMPPFTAIKYAIIYT